jgi:hypothetical protein
MTIYFGDKIGSEASSLLKALSDEPNHTLDIHVAIEQIEKLKSMGNLNLDSITTMMSPYLMTVDKYRSPSLEQRLEKLDVTCSVL